MKASILLALAAAALIAAIGGSAMAAPAHAQQGPRLSALEIEIWPEFDKRSTALVILRGRLAESVGLPATIELNLPAASGGPTAVASAPSGTANLITRNFEISRAESTIRVTFQTPDALFQIEFYEPLATDTLNRVYTFEWLGDLATDQLTIRVQEPAAASNLTIEPPLGSVTPSPGGLTYRTADMGAFEAGRSLRIDVRYQKDGVRTSAEILGLATPDVQGSGDGGVSPLLFLGAAAAVFVIGLGAVLYWRWDRERRAIAVPVAPLSRRAERRAAARRRRRPGASFCRRCGNELDTDDLFCSRCGAAVSR